MHLRIEEYQNYKHAEIVSLYQSVGWTNYTCDLEMLKKAYENSFKIFAAYDGDALIGVIRAVGDGCSIIYIQDILVRPEYQHMGVGTGLANKMLSECDGVYQTVLLTENTAKTIKFYKSLGFSMVEDINCAAFLKTW